MLYTASLGLTVVGFPLDSLKTRMQTHSYNGLLDCFRKTINHEGFGGLFRGIGAPLVSIACSKSLAVSLYTWAKPKVQEIQLMTNFDSKVTLPVARNFPSTFLGGSITGILVSFWACPFEFTKLYSQLSFLEQQKALARGQATGVVETNIVGVSRQIISVLGFKGLYLGLKLHIFRELIGSALYFSVYETVKLSVNLVNRKSESSLKGPFAIAMAGGLAGVVSWLTIFPIDTLKLMVQRDIVSAIIRRDMTNMPVRRLRWPTARMYRGLSATVARLVINSMVFFGLFEYLMHSVA